MSNHVKNKGFLFFNWLLLMKYSYYGFYEFYHIMRIILWAGLGTSILFLLLRRFWSRSLTSVSASSLHSLSLGLWWALSGFFRISPHSGVPFRKIFGSKVSGLIWGHSQHFDTLKVEIQLKRRDSYFRHTSVSGIPRLLRKCLWWRNYDVCYKNEWMCHNHNVFPEFSDKNFVTFMVKRLKQN